MAYYLTMDGGGSKLNLLLYDENFQPLARGKGGGVNTTQNDPAVAAQSVRDALAAIPPEITEIEAVRAVFVGRKEMLSSLLQERLHVKKLEFLGESQAGLLAGSGRKSGLLAIAGTGSDVFRILPDETVQRVGGWGPILGDQGSGAWIGLQAVRSAVREVDGWGEHTVLTQKILKKYGVTERPFALVPVVYGNKAPFTLIASLTRLVAEAAGEGDKVALEILRQAGTVLGVQMNALLRTFPAEDEDPVITLCGGAWKSHPIMAQAFAETVSAQNPAYTVQRPWFEHVIAGAMQHALENGMTAAQAHTLFRQNFAQEALS